jgi:hypothetical protein
VGKTQIPGWEQRPLSSATSGTPERVYHLRTDAGRQHFSSIRSSGPQTGRVNHKLNGGICIDRISLKKSRTIPLPGAGRTMIMRCTAKAALFQQTGQQPQELALHTKLRIALSPDTFSSSYLLHEGRMLESFWKKRVGARLRSITPFLKDSPFDSRLPQEIECKLAQFLDLERSSGCTCIQGQPSSPCTTVTEMWSSRCEVHLIDKTRLGSTSGVCFRLLRGVERTRLTIFALCFKKSISGNLSLGNCRLHYP